MKKKQILSVSPTRIISKMEIVTSLFQKLFIIITLFIPCVLVAVVKVLLWIARKLYDCVRRVFEFFNACTAAMRRTEPTITVRIRGNDTVPVTSGNVESRRVKTTNQNKKNKKPYKEKQEFVTIPAPFNGMKHARAAGCISSKGNFDRTVKVAPSTTRPLWGPHSDVNNQKGRNYNQDHLPQLKFESNSGRITNPLSLKPQLPSTGHIVRKDSVHKTEKAAPSLNSTRTPWRPYSDFPNKTGNNFSQALSSRYEQLHQISNMEVSSNSRPAQHPVRLWSVDINVETATPASDIQHPECQWHDVSGSDSDSDCGDKHELSELLDSEIIAKYSELEDVLDHSPEHVERLAKLLPEKESSSRQCNM